MIRSEARSLITLLSLAFLTLASAHAQAETSVVARCGEGFLQSVDGYKVLHVRGTPYEMGYQHGVLLKDDIHALVRFLLDVKAKEFGEALEGDVLGIPFKPDPKSIISMIQRTQRRFVPDRYYEELRGLADGAEIDFDEILLCNFIPELFHCSGFALSGSATRDGTLYHGRVLDYGCDWGLQDRAVLIVAKPEGLIPFVNVTYAGFIGSVTGMNAAQVSIGEMGGRGLGRWVGTPMAFLVRIALEEAGSLDDAIAIFRDRPRTCEYYYVIADGKIGKGVGMEASWNKFGVVQMGERHSLLPHSVEDAVLLSAGDRYEELVRRVKQSHGSIDAEKAIRLMDRPVAMSSNLHNVLFETSSGRFWIANASTDGQPAATQPYQAFEFSDLLRQEVDLAAPVLKGPELKRPIVEQENGAR